MNSSRQYHKRFTLMNIITRIIPEVKTWLDRLFGWFGLFTRRLGRHVRFDERSRDYRVLLDGVPVTLRARTWERAVPAFNQGSLGSCTGNAVLGLIVTEPNDRDSFADKIVANQTLAVALYSRATSLDQFNGEYPPEDTGSSVLSAMKAAKEMWLIKEYRWCFGIEDVLRTLSYVGPVVIGCNWYAGFDKPNSYGQVFPTGGIRGGHAFELLGIDPDERLVWGINSWGSRWGKSGRFSIGFDDLHKLLKEDGEAVTVKV